MFTYKERKIHSAIPISEIKAYLFTLGAEERPGSVYEYKGLEIEVTPYQGDVFPNLNMPRHTIDVRGDKALAEEFLTAFRLRFMSAGG